MQFRLRAIEMVLTLSPQPDLLRAENLRHILLSPGPCVTVILPPRPPDAADLESLLKSNLRELTQHLQERGIAPEVVWELVNPLNHLANDYSLASNSEWGRVILRSPCVFEQYYLALPAIPGGGIGNCFAVRRLVDELSRPDSFHILCLDMTGASLWKCSGISAHLADLPGAISPLDGSPFEYYSQLAHSLAPLFHCAPGPLLLAGREDDLAIFRSAIHGSDLAANIARASLPPATEVKQISSNVLQTAYAIIRGEEMDRQAHTAKAARARVPNAGVSTDPDAIIRAAFAGRICELYVSADASWPDEDMLNLAIAETIVHHGIVSPLPHASTSEGFQVAAVLRY